MNPDAPDCWACGMPNVMRPDGSVGCCDRCPESEMERPAAPYDPDESGPTPCFECDRDPCACQEPRTTH